ncbi:MAG: matrixin family metalloprotease [Candidatus Eisenbacteria bacterium]|uniref:Matrixin family metalloprotease n=1 Tax=Eiseniibacteriota bacterium TaxID=2212470 RepID=A0A538U4Q4_UNCEI|nr:MAG: matrixin family metalloprotease [Candidatus Eisenbacteria bacterium]
MNTLVSRGLALAAACTALLSAADAQAYRMIQNTVPGRTSTGARVLCDDPAGFAHWTTSSISWRLNTANQGGKPGVATSLQKALASWTNVSPASYALGYAGTTTAGFVTDGVNTVQWANGNGCTGGCLAITALVLSQGQVITESDISFNDSAIWNANGADYDVEAIAAHELGHSLGIHHTEITKQRDRPTMYASYFGTAGRTLEGDDVAALNCAFARYAPASPSVLGLAAAGVTAGAAPAGGVKLSGRARAGGAILRFALANQEPVKLELYDVAGRRLTTLIDGTRSAGEYEVAWDGASGFGRVGPGVYFARIVTIEGAASTTVILAR